MAALISERVVNIGKAATRTTAHSDEYGCSHNDDECEKYGVFGHTLPFTVS